MISQAAWFYNWEKKGSNFEYVEQKQQLSKCRTLQLADGHLSGGSSFSCLCLSIGQKFIERNHRKREEQEEEQEDW